MPDVLLKTLQSASAFLQPCGSRGDSQVWSVHETLFYKNTPVLHLSMAFTFDSTQFGCTIWYFAGALWDFSRNARTMVFRMHTITAIWHETHQRHGIWWCFGNLSGPSPWGFAIFHTNRVLIRADGCKKEIVPRREGVVLLFLWGIHIKNLWCARKREKPRRRASQTITFVVRKSHKKQGKRFREKESGKYGGKSLPKYPRNFLRALFFIFQFHGSTVSKKMTRANSLKPWMAGKGTIRPIQRK